MAKTLELEHMALKGKERFCQCFRLSMQLVLLVIFLHYFGLPAVSRYQMREVMVVSSRRDTGGIQAPGLHQGEPLQPGGLQDQVGPLESDTGLYKSRTIHPSPYHHTLAALALLYVITVTSF